MNQREIAKTATGLPIRECMADEEFYRGIDPGIRYAVRVLHAAGIETCQSCQGGAGHAYPEPTVELRAGADDAIGFAALAALRDLPVSRVALVWNIARGMPYEKLWSVTFSATMEDCADEEPLFIWCYHHRESPAAPADVVAPPPPLIGVGNLTERIEALPVVPVERKTRP